LTRSRRLASLAVLGAAAIEYQLDSRFWYATTNGKLAYRQPDGTFAFGTGPGAVAFNDIAFQAAGQEGVAVGNGNNVWHTGDGGHSWSKVTLPATIDNDDCWGAPGAGTSTFDIGPSVTYASDQTVYVTGDRGHPALGQRGRLVRRDQQAAGHRLPRRRRRDHGLLLPRRERRLVPRALLRRRVRDERRPGERRDRA
jgi:hypothetical protein